MMPLSEILFLAIVFYLLYRFVFNFLVPIFRTTRHVREQFRNMQGGMGQQQQQQTRTQTPPQQPRPQERHSSPHGRPEDYIDFEEVKK